MTALIYTHAPDFLMATYAARCLHACGVRPLLVVDHRDACLAAEGIEVIRSTFARQGNLNGREFIAGNLRLMLEHAQAESADYVLKVDSDTLVRDLSWLRGRTATAVGIYVPKMAGMYGACYALRVRDLPAMIEEADRLDPRLWHLEDRVTGELAAALGPVHLPVYGRDKTGFTTWRPGKAADYAAHSVLMFPRLPKQGHGREQIAEAMKPFLP